MLQPHDASCTVLQHFWPCLPMWANASGFNHQCKVHIAAELASELCLAIWLHFEESTLTIAEGIVRMRAVQMSDNVRDK